MRIVSIGNSAFDHCGVHTAARTRSHGRPCDLGEYYDANACSAGERNNFRPPENSMT